MDVLTTHLPVLLTTRIECVVFWLGIVLALILIAWDRHTGKGG